MPYMMDGLGVYKKNADGSKGELVRMHKTKEDAEAHMKALMANVKDEMMASLRTADVHELIDLSEAVLDESRYAARVRLVKAGWSLNERYYSDKVLAEAAKIWEGRKAYADHPSSVERKDRPERSVRDIVGYYENVSHDADQTTRADFVVVGEARTWLWPLIKETVEKRVPLVGMSINALGQARKGEAEGRRGLVIEAITHANSVDVVTEPAAGGGVERLLMSDDGWTRAVLSNLTLDELREARPDILEALKREWKTTRDHQAIQDARAQTAHAETKAQQLDEQYRTSQAALSEALDTIQALRREQLVDRLLDNDKLPKSVRGELRDKLLAAQNGEAMQSILSDAIALLGAVRLPVRVTGAGRPASPLVETAPAKPGNPVAAALGIDPRLANATTLEEFQEAKQHSQGV